MAQMQALLSEKDDVIEKKSDVIAHQQQRIEQLEEYLRLLKHKRFGASSEQTPPEQGNLFEEEFSPEPEISEETTTTESSEPKGKTGRKPPPVSG